MESKELLYTAYRVHELKALLPEGLSGPELQKVEELVESRDDVALIGLLEQMNLSEQSRRRLQIIKEARPIAQTIVALWREMPLRHEEIESQYKQLQQLKDRYDHIVPRRGGVELL